jgi:hypothetical protein
MVTHWVLPGGASTGLLMEGLEAGREGTLLE